MHATTRSKLLIRYFPVPMPAELSPNAVSAGPEKNNHGGKKDSEGCGVEALVQRKVDGRKREPVWIF